MNFIRASLAVWVLSFAPLFAAPDEDVLGKSKGYPLGTSSTSFVEPFRVGSFSGMDRIFPFHTIKKSEAALPLKEAAQRPSYTYSFVGKTLTVEDYMDRQRVTGLLIIKDGDLVLERYQYDRNERHRFTSFSMAKSVVSLAVGLALHEGKIESLDDKAGKYVRDLAEDSYGQTSIRHLLRMSSGVHFVEDYSGKDDLARFKDALATKGTVAALKLFQDRDSAPGEHMHYASIETAVVGLVLRAATGKSLSDYVSEKIWKPMGAEAEATWIIDSEGNERAFGYLNAVLRDYGRLGCLLANDGKVNDRQVIPRDYLLEATDWHRHPEAFRPGKATPFFGYGYQFWLFPGEKRRFALLGIFGQSIFVDPELKLVMVQTAVAKEASDKDMSRERAALWRGIIAHFDRR